MFGFKTYQDRVTNWLLMVVVVAFLMGFSACFQLREPAKPTQLTGWTTPTEPDVLIDNFKQAVQGLNVVNYERCFKSESYRFVPDPTVSGQNVGIFQRWTMQEELEYLKNILNRNSGTGSNRLDFTSPRRIFLTADSLEFNATYALQVFHTDTAFRFYQFQGNVLLTMVRGRNNEWSIRSWQDNRVAGQRCWSDLKQYFVSP